MKLIEDLGVIKGMRKGIYICEECGTTKEIRTQSVIQGNSHCGCKLELIDIIEPLKFISVGEHSKKIKWNVLCTCGEAFSAIRSELIARNITKCGKCRRKSSNTTKKLNTQYIRELFLKRPDIQVLEKYVGSNIPILHKHICGYTWKVLPDTLLNTDTGVKCHNCASSGSFEPGKPTILYFIKLKNHPLYKIGITKYSVKERYKYENCDIVELAEWQFPCGKQAYEMEQHILSNFKQHITALPSPFRDTSNTEIFDNNILEELKCYMESHSKK